MELIEFTKIWVQGESTQGKIMTIFGVILLISCILIWRSSDEILRGMLIPLSLVTIVLLGIGIAFPIHRQNQLKAVQAQYQENPSNAIQIE